MYINNVIGHVLSLIGNSILLKDLSLEGMTFSLSILENQQIGPTAEFNISHPREECGRHSGRSGLSRGVRGT